jgi:hypothetical protein
MKQEDRELRKRKQERINSIILTEPQGQEDLKRYLFTKVLISDSP